MISKSCFYRVNIQGWKELGFLNLKFIKTTNSKTNTTHLMRIEQMLFYSKFHLGEKQQSPQITQDLQVLENIIRENLWKSCRYTVSPHLPLIGKRKVEMKSLVSSSWVKWRQMTNIELDNK